MLARLTTLCEGSLKDCQAGKGRLRLHDKLTTRNPQDPAIAILDAWSLVGDILTFYQERIANEGYLRTANDRRSLYELSRLIGYAPRPGVASSVYLAFEVEPQPTVTTANGLPNPGTPATGSLDTEILIPKGTQVKSTPAPGSDEQPQTFETSYNLPARPAWNRLRPQLTSLPAITPETVLDIDEFHFKGLGLRLPKNAWLALVLDRRRDAVVYQIDSVEEDQDRQTTRVILRGNDLAVPRLLDELDGIVTTFLSHNALSTLEQPFLQELDDRLTEFVVEARRQQRAWRLPGVDREFDGLICVDFLSEDATNAKLRLPDGRTLRKTFKDLSTWAGEVKATFSSSTASSLTSTHQITIDYAPDIYNWPMPFAIGGTHFLHRVQHPPASSYEWTSRHLPAKYLKRKSFFGMTSFIRADSGQF